MTNWIQLTNQTQLEEAITASHQQDVVLFKHSTRCSISAMALQRLEREWPSNNNLKAYFLDLITYRPISNTIAETFDVQHESPQILLIRNGKCSFHTSHGAIRWAAIPLQQN
jgi:bacillithiol system protein YtxJ